MTSFLDNLYDHIKRNVKSANVCTTADIWTAHNKSFLGMSAHWLDPTTLERKKAAIVCQRFKGRHTYDAIAAAVEDIHASYSLSEIKATVTDNSSNFVKAFRVFQSNENDLMEVVAGMNDAECQAYDEDDIADFTDMAEVLSVNEHEQTYSLPPHKRCASHTKNLISKDTEKAQAASAEKNTYRSAFAKCSALWNKASRSTIIAEIIEEICVTKLVVPTETRWNSFYDSVSKVVKIDKQDAVCNKVGVKAFTEKEFQYLRDYSNVVQPLA